MTLEAVSFWVVAAALVASSLAVVLTPNLFRAVLYLAAALVATAILMTTSMASAAKRNQLAFWKIPRQSVSVTLIPLPANLEIAEGHRNASRS